MTTSATTPPSKPNILFIMADQFRADALGSVGGYTRTPNLDRIAAGGTLFTRVVTNSPECIPARFALATGLYPHQTGVWANGQQTLSPEAWTWMRALRDAGYRTSLFGKTHFHESAHPSHDLRDGLGLMHSYGLDDIDEIAGPRASRHIRSNMTDLWERDGLLQAYRDDLNDRLATKPQTVRPSPLGLSDYYDTYVADRACAYLRDYDAAEPWFCWVSFSGPHEPWDAPVPYDTMFAPDDMPAPIAPGSSSDPGRPGLLRQRHERCAPMDLQPGEIAAMRANYAGNVALIDDLIGRVLAVLEARGEAEDTIVVFTSDHGEMNGDHGLVYKGNFLAPAMDVPLIVRVPGGKGPSRSQALVELIDVGATLADLGGAAPGETSCGRSLAPVLRGEAEEHRGYVVAEFQHHTMLADARWKVEFGQQGRAILVIDRQRDPEERENLAGTGEAQDVAEAFGAHLAAFRQQTGDERKITL